MKHVIMMLTSVVVASALVTSCGEKASPGGELTAWSEADFIKTLRTGVTPSGTNLPDKFMPWQFKSQMTDDELKAVFAYLKSLPPLTTSTQPAE